MTVRRVSRAGVVVLALVSFPIPAMATDEVTGDPEAGKKAFMLCQACHSVEPGQNRMGPHLHNIIGRKAGSVENFKYSPAHKNSGIIWTPETLDPYLKNPASYIPENRMVFAGVGNNQQRANIIAYLALEKVSPDAPGEAGEPDGGEGEDNGLKVRHDPVPVR